MCALDPSPISGDLKLRTVVKEDIPNSFFCSTDRFRCFEFPDIYCCWVRFFVVYYASSKIQVNERQREGETYH